MDTLDHFWTYEGAWGSTNTLGGGLKVGVACN